MKHHFVTICKDMAILLPSVGEKLLTLRKNAKNDPDFVRLKADKTLVTHGDTLSEDLIRAWIQEHFPDDTIRGEERMEKQGGLFQWIIDPIDGTYNFNHHSRMFSISVGLTEDNTPKMGVLLYPAENIVVSATEGAGAEINGQPIVLSKKKHKLDEAVIYRQPTNLSPEYFSQPRFTKTLKQQARILSPSPTIEGISASFTFAFLKFLQGNMDAILHPGATPYDIGAICAIAKEIGFSFSGYDGEAIDFSKETIPIVISKSAWLHAQIIQTLNSDN